MTTADAVHKFEVVTNVCQTKDYLCGQLGTLFRHMFDTVTQHREIKRMKSNLAEGHDLVNTKISAEITHAEAKMKF